MPKEYTIKSYNPKQIADIRDRHFPGLSEESTVCRLVNAGIEAVDEYRLSDNPMLDSIFFEYQDSYRLNFETSCPEIEAAEFALIKDASLTEAQQEALIAIHADVERQMFKAGFKCAMRLLAECGVSIPTEGKPDA